MAKHNANKTRRGKKSTVKKVVKSARKSRKVRKSRKNAIFGGHYYNNYKKNYKGIIPTSFKRNIYVALEIPKLYTRDPETGNKILNFWNDNDTNTFNDIDTYFTNYMTKLYKYISDEITIDNIVFASYKNKKTLTSVYGNELKYDAIIDNDLKIRIIRLFFVLLASKYMVLRIPVKSQYQDEIRKRLIEEYEDVKTEFLKKSSDADYWIVHNAVLRREHNTGRVVEVKTVDINNLQPNHYIPTFEFKFDAPTKLLGKKRPGFRFIVRKNIDTITRENYETKDHVDKDTIAF